MYFNELVEVSERVRSTRSRKQKVEYLRAAIVALSEEELSIALKYLSGQLRQGKIGIGASLVKKASTSIDSSDLPRERLSLADVDRRISDLAQIRGAGSTAKRTQTLVSLLREMSSTSRDFLCRILLGEVRQGALDGVLVEAIAVAFHVSVETVRRGLMLTGDLAEVAVRACREGEAGVRRFSLQLFRPILPMLADTAEDVHDAIARLKLASLEFKLDGVRLQIHKDHDEVRVYTRHLNDVTKRLPEVCEVAHQFHAKRCILDGEVLAFSHRDSSSRRPLPFQETMRRLGRTSDINQLREELPLDVVLFDCLAIDDQTLIDEPTSQRHDALMQVAPTSLCVPRLTTADATEAEQFFQRAVNEGHEGLMAKSPDAMYSAGGRGQNWLKIKPFHTLDLVVLAAEWGSGRRRGWLSNLHLGARTSDAGRFAMIGKTFKGLTDERLAWQTTRLLALEHEREGSVVYVRPELVVEIAFNEVQQSRQYSSGYALRFARVKRYRTEKSPLEADSLETVQQIFRAARQLS